MNRNKMLLYVGGAIVLIVFGSLFLKFTLPVVSVGAEALPGLGITNAYLTSIVVVLIITVTAFLATRNMQLVPSGLQNLIEMIVETLYNLTENVSGPKWAARFFVIPTTIFIYVLVSNWFGLIPGLAGIGFCHAPAHGEGESAAVEEEAHAEAQQGLVLFCKPGEEIIPLFRSPSADLNNTLMLALVTQIAAQFFGFSALGAAGYLGKFFIVDKLKSAFGPDEHGQKRSSGGMMGLLAFGLIDLFVGLLEGLSEFVKVIAFTFRLFGNIFAGEVMLIVITFLVPLVLTIPFLGFEVFVGLVQAFIFFILSVAFYTVAVTPHGGHEEGH